MNTELRDTELNALRRLTDIGVFVDVGARMTSDKSIVPCVLDYLTIFPKAQYHLFEPNPVHFAKLVEATAGYPNVRVNQVALGDTIGTRAYSKEFEAIVGGEAEITTGDFDIPIATLDAYVKDVGIQAIDFLKIDAEGYDYRVLLGASDILKRTRYIQFEVWNNLEQFHTLLGDRFTIEDIGFRNYLCTKKS